MHIRGRSLPITTYRKRRRRALKLLQKSFDSAVPLLLIGIPEHNPGNMLSPVGGSPRQDPWFEYFTGCHEHDAALLLDPNSTNSDTLFLDPGDQPHYGPRCLFGGAGQRRNGGRLRAP